MGIFFCLTGALLAHDLGLKSLAPQILIGGTPSDWLCRPVWEMVHSLAVCEHSVGQIPWTSIIPPSPHYSPGPSSLGPVSLEGRKPLLSASLNGEDYSFFPSPFSVWVYKFSVHNLKVGELSWKGMFRSNSHFFNTTVNCFVLKNTLFLKSCPSNRIVSYWGQGPFF